MSTYRLIPDLMAVLSGEMKPVHVGADYVNFEIAGRIHTFPLELVEAVEAPIPDEPESGAVHLGGDLYAVRRTDSDQPYPESRWQLNRAHTEPREYGGKTSWRAVGWGKAVEIACANGLADPVPLLTAEEHLAALLADAPELPHVEHDTDDDVVAVDRANVRRMDGSLFVTGGAYLDKAAARRHALAVLRWAES